MIPLGLADKPEERNKYMNNLAKQGPNSKSPNVVRRADKRPRMTSMSGTVKVAQNNEEIKQSCPPLRLQRSRLSTAGGAAKASFKQAAVVTAGTAVITQQQHTKKLVELTPPLPTISQVVERIISDEDDDPSSDDEPPPAMDKLEDDDDDMTNLSADNQSNVKKSTIHCFNKGLKLYLFDRMTMRVGVQVTHNRVTWQRMEPPPQAPCTCPIHLKVRFIQFTLWCCYLSVVDFLFNWCSWWRWSKWRSIDSGRFWRCYKTVCVSAVQPPIQTQEQRSSSLEIRMWRCTFLSLSSKFFIFIFKFYFVYGSNGCLWTILAGVSMG